jgi:transcriptional antiterminator RfaH
MDSLCPSTEKWYVIYTKPHGESRAQGELQKKHITVFLPKIRKIRFRNQRLLEIIQPLFPSYIFARFAIPEDYYRVKWAPGVKRIVGSGDLPIPLDESIIQFLKGQATEEGLVQPQPDLQNGDRVRVLEGPLEGLQGVVNGGVDAKGRVRILMDILHAGAKIDLPYSHLERCTDFS